MLATESSFPQNRESFFQAKLATNGRDSSILSTLGKQTTSLAVFEQQQTQEKKKIKVPEWLQHVAYRIYAFEVCMYAAVVEI